MGFLVFFGIPVSFILFIYLFFMHAHRIHFSIISCKCSIRTCLKMTASSSKNSYRVDFNSITRLFISRSWWESWHLIAKTTYMYMYVQNKSQFTCSAWFYLTKKFPSTRSLDSTYTLQYNCKNTCHHQ